MSVLHIIRRGGDDAADPVVRAQAEAGVELALVTLGGTLPDGDGARYAVGPGAPDGVSSIDWNGVVDLVFAADQTVVW